MRRLCLMGVVVFAACSPAEKRVSGEAPPLSAVVTRSETSVQDDGVTQVVRYQERFVRAGERVWIERIGRRRTPRAHAHPSFDAVPKLITRRAEGGVRLQLVLEEERVLVDVPDEEFDSVGFAPDWSELTQLFASQGLRELKPAGTAEGAEWLRADRPDGTVRVLWSDELGLALKVESTRADGSLSRTLNAVPQGLPATLPWDQLEGFERKRLEEYRD